MLLPSTPPTSLPGFHEPFSALSHLGAALVFAALTVPLLRRARGSALRVAALAIFALTTVFLLSMSGVFHMLSTGGTPRAVLARLDQAAIFALIAGTHTPVQALFFRGRARWGVSLAMWLLAATGIVLFSVFHDALPRGLGLSIYLALGWLAGTAGFLIWRRAGFREVRLLLLGGVAYSLGAILLGLEWPTVLPGIVGPHELWHVAVLTALGMHWLYLYRRAGGVVLRAGIPRRR
jgi:channel protein (hemolysin III family)